MQRCITRALGAAAVAGWLILIWDALPWTDVPESRCTQVGAYGLHMETPEQEMRRVARAVSTALQAAGISQREAADATGIPINTLSRRLTGKTPLNVNELAALGGLVGKSVSELVAA